MVADSKQSFVCKVHHTQWFQVLGELGNRSPNGILSSGGSNDRGKYNVTWAGVVSGRTVPND